MNILVLFLLISDDFNNESKDHIEQKKEAIKEGVCTCLNLLRPIIRENNQITPTIDTKKKIIIKKKTFNILHENSDDENEKENQAISPLLDENSKRRQTVRGSNTSKRSVSLKTPDKESPPKRTKTTEDIDVPLPIISPAIVKKITPSRKKTTDDGGEEKPAKSIRLIRKAQQTTDDSKSNETIKLTKKQKEEEIDVRII